MGRHLQGSDQRPVAVSRAVVLGGILLLSAVLLWTDTIAPRFVGSVLTFTAAAAWCRWLELHPDDSPAQSGADSTDGITGSR